MSTTGNKLLRGSAMRLLASFVNLAVGLFLMPIVIRQLGDRHYGIWALSASFLGFYGLFEFGISNAVARFISRALGTRDEDDLISYFATSFYILCILAFLVAMLAGVLAWAGAWFLDDPSDAELFRWLAIILGLSIALRFPTRAFHGVLKSHLRYDLISAIEIAGALVRAPLILLVLRAGHGLVGMAVASASLELAMEVGKVLLTWRIHPTLTLAFRYVSFARARTILGYGSNVLVASIADIMRFKASPFLIATLRTVSLVTPFAVAMRLSQILSQLLLAMVGVLTPIFSRLEGMGQWRRIRDGYLLACRISTYASVLCGGLMIVLAGSFIERWLGPQYAHVAALLQVLVIGAICTCSQIPGMSVLYGTSHHKFYTLSNLTHGVLTLVLTLVLIGPFGLMGAALGSTIPSVLVKFVLQPLYVCRVLQIHPGRWYLQHVLRDYAVPVAYLLAIYPICRALAAPSYLTIFAMGAICVLCFVPYALLVGLSRPQRELIFKSLAARRVVAAR